MKQEGADIPAALWSWWKGADKGEGRVESTVSSQTQCRLEKSGRQSQQLPGGRHYGFMAKSLDFIVKRAVWFTVGS